MGIKGIVLSVDGDGDVCELESVLYEMKSGILVIHHFLKSDHFSIFPPTIQFELMLE